MKTKATRVILVLCALLLACGSLFACAKDSGKQPNGTTPPTSQTSGDDGNNGDNPQPPAEQTEEQIFRPAKQDFNDYTYRMVFDGGLPLNYWGHQEGMVGDALDVAFYNRNEYLQAQFNINIELSAIASEQYRMADELSVACSTGLDFADAIFGVAQHVLQSAVPNGYALDLMNVAGLNLGASYWDQRIQQEYLLEGKLFALEGDFTVYDELRTHVVLYNGSLYNSFGYSGTYGSPYEMVRDGEWTLETMLTMIEGRSDLSTGVDLTSNSNWGMLSETPFPYIVYLGTGMKNIEVQDDGSVNLLFADQAYYNNVYNIIESIMQKVGLNREVLFADASNGVLTGDVWTGVSNMFETNKALFRTTTLSAATRLTNMESAYGILPIPKYEKTQETYYSWCTSDAHCPLVIPATALQHIETTAAITEALCYHSKYMDGGTTQTVLEAFYENMAVAKLCRTAEDYAMLQLIFANKTYDIDGALNVTGIRHKLTTLISKRDITTLSSDFSSIRESSMTKLSNLITDMLKNVKN